MSSNRRTPRPGRDGGRGSGRGPHGNWEGRDTSGPSGGRRRGRTHPRSREVAVAAAGGVEAVDAGPETAILASS